MDFNKNKSDIQLYIYNALNIEISDGWGWFLDIDIQTNRQINKFSREKLKHVYIPQTIYETPTRMQSFKSMTNLHDESMIFKMDEQIEKQEKQEKQEKKKEINHNNMVDYFVNTICTLCIIGIIYKFNFI